MLRKTKDTETTPKAEERTLQRATDYRSPFSWFDEMDGWFEDFRREFDNRFGGPVTPWSRRRETGLRTRAPLVDLLDTGREFLVKAEIPGVAKEDLDINVTAEGIELRAEAKGEKEENDRDYSCRERVYSAFHRAFSFPEEVLPDQAEATLKDGVLEVRVPKNEPTPKRKPVKVKVN